LNIEKKPYSLKQQLTVSAGMLVSALLLVSIYFSFQSARHEVGEVYDARLGQSAKLMLLTLSLSSKENSLSEQSRIFNQWMQNIRALADKDDDVPTAYGHPYEQNLVFQFYRDNRILWSSSPDLKALSTSPDYNGYADVRLNGTEWRTFQLSSNDNAHAHEFVVVAEKHRIRKEIINEIALSASIAQLLTLPVLLVLLFWVIDKYFRPIEQLRSAINQRSAQRLDRISVTDNTLELSPLVDALNALLTALEQSRQREKRFTHAAAHELKTPFAILRLNAENALENQDPQQFRDCLENILQGIGRTDRLIHQLLSLARVEQLTNPAQDKVALTPLLQAVIADLAPMALKKNQDIGLTPAPATLSGDRVLLEVMFRNLIDNAIRYAGDHARIQASILKNKDSIQVRVSDNGPNIGQATRTRIFEKFYRGRSSQGDGAGLGLSICSDIATLHSASLVLLPRDQDMNSFLVTFREG
jgi:two-component system sensor histidine kinase QseC